MDTTDKGIITDSELLQIYGVSRPGGVAQINSTNTPRVSTALLYCSGDAYIYGCIKTPLKLCTGALLADGSVTNPALAFENEPATGIYRAADGTIGFAVDGVSAAEITQDSLQVSSITTANGANLLLNPTGPYIDCNWRTLINVGGILPDQGGGGGTINPNSYTFIAPNYILTSDATPTQLYSIPTVSNAGYLFTTMLTCVNVTDGQSTASFIISVKVKNINGAVTTSALIESNICKDIPLASITAGYSVLGTSVNITVTGIANTQIKWFGSTNITRQLF